MFANCSLDQGRPAQGLHSDPVTDSTPPLQPNYCFCVKALVDLACGSLSNQAIQGMLSPNHGTSPEDGNTALGRMLLADRFENAKIRQAIGLITWDSGRASKDPGTPAPPGDHQHKSDCLCPIARPQGLGNGELSFNRYDTSLNPSPRSRPAPRGNTHPHIRQKAVPCVSHAGSTAALPRPVIRSPSKDFRGTGTSF